MRIALIAIFLLIYGCTTAPVMKEEFGCLEGNKAELMLPKHIAKEARVLATSYGRENISALVAASAAVSLGETVRWADVYPHLEMDKDVGGTQYASLLSMKNALKPFGVKAAGYELVLPEGLMNVIKSNDVMIAIETSPDGPPDDPGYYFVAYEYTSSYVDILTAAGVFCRVSYEGLASAISKKPKVLLLPPPPNRSLQARRP